ncbi:MAG: FAD-dependent oxidoreductase [Alphaproteobacteria bacterium]|nr:FAD-dependent oxidoreductase [Alphaproteobacteria bacterium]
MNGSKRLAATVIGAGIVGICCASYLQREGYQVEIIDPELPGTQCSHGNAGGVCPGSCVPIAMPGMLRKVPGWLMDPEGPLFIRLSYLPHAMPWIARFLLAGQRRHVERISTDMRNLHRLTFDCYEPLLRDAGCTDLVEQRGQLFVYETPNAIDMSDYGLSLRRARGVKVEILDRDALRALEPALAPLFHTGVYLPEQGQCSNPGRLVRMLAEHLARQGATFTRSRVEGFEFGDHGVTGLATDGGRRPVQNVVVAAGAWSGRLAAQLGSRVPLESERGYHVMVEGMDAGLRIQTIWSERKFVASPMEEGMRFAGTVEFAGLAAPPDMARADVLLRQGLRMFPQLKPDKVSRWMGHRPGMPDTIPVIDRSRHHRNVYFAFGHGHMGLIGGSVTGKLISELVAGKPTSIDVHPYRATRF